MTYEQYRSMVVDEVVSATKMPREEADRMTGDVSEELDEGLTASEAASSVLAYAAENS